jgi:hypothetical protein
MNQNRTVFSVQYSAPKAFGNAFSGVRPSSGAACSASSGLPNSGGASGVSDVAAPEDGRTPLNRYAFGSVHRRGVTR